MPHKDRAHRLAYLREHHQQHRPPPQPQPQPDPALPPLGVLIYDDDGTRVQCHVCGRFYGALPGHIRVHGLDAARYKEQFGLARTTSLASPQHQERQRQAALARDQGAVGRAALAELGPAPGRPRGLDTRLASRLIASAAKRGTYHGRPHVSDAAPAVTPPQPRTLTCARCGQPFTIAAGVRWAKYCPACRPAAYREGQARLTDAQPRRQPCR